eukprot:gene883-biopygen4481
MPCSYWCYMVGAIRPTTYPQKLAPRGDFQVKDVVYTKWDTEATDASERLQSHSLKGDPQAQRRLISEVLGPLYQANRSSLVLMGDFNFTLDDEMDRFNGAASSNTSHPDQLTSSLFATTCPKLPCAFRHRHPTRRSFTHFWSTGASRLDRAHVSEQLLPYILQC